MELKLNRWIVFGVALLLSACDSLKDVQSFNIYVSGTYSLEKECSGMPTVEIGSDKISYGKTQCEVSKVELINSQPGWQMTVKNCVSDLNPIPEKTKKTVRILIDKDNNKKIENWFKYGPNSIYKCEMK